MSEVQTYDAHEYCGGRAVSRPWHPSAPQVGQLARGESIVEWSGKHGWRVVPLSEIPEEPEA